MPRDPTQRVDQGQQLAARVVGAGAITKVGQLVDDGLDAGAFGEGGGQQQPGVGDRVVIVERHNKPRGAVGGWHREGAP
ncbi:MAG TPA: hypothetical protein VFD04_06635 [Actinomycetes bacterium]|jgi:hypothetical protein|nr:hypothetical protein [Actinomycetes bacterium]